MKEFTFSDVEGGVYLHVSPADLIVDEPAWMQRGLSQTRSGYGDRLNTGRKILFERRRYRLYCTRYSNVGSVWFRVRGRTIVVVGG